MPLVLPGASYSAPLCRSATSAQPLCSRSFLGAAAVAAPNVAHVHRLLVCGPARRRHSVRQVLGVLADGKLLSCQLLPVDQASSRLSLDWAYANSYCVLQCFMPRCGTSKLICRSLRHLFVHLQVTQFQLIASR